MKKSTFHISKMDCPSEEQMIRMKLEPLSQVKHLEFDIPARKLEVFHQDEVLPIQNTISELNLSDQLQGTSEAEMPLAERLTYTIEDKGEGSGAIRMSWEKLSVSLPFKTD
ncbi:MAG TPA: hypothetical protein DCL81_16890 [Algoriphagus sp.]|nr:hypothetical protein [Algoriphagus sp.]